MLCILGLSKNLFRILWNITTVVGIMHRGSGWECRMYAQLIAINISIYTKKICVGGGWWERMIWQKDVIKVIEWWLVLSSRFFYSGFACDLVGLLINSNQHTYFVTIFSVCLSPPPTPTFGLPGNNNGPKSKGRSRVLPFTHDPPLWLIWDPFWKRGTQNWVVWCDFNDPRKPIESPWSLDWFITSIEWVDVMDRFHQLYSFTYQWGLKYLTHILASPVVTHQGKILQAGILPWAQFPCPTPPP